MIHIGSAIATSVSVRPKVPCLVDSVTCVHMVSSTPLAPKIILLPHILWGFQAPSGSLYLLPSEAGENLSEEDWARYQQLLILNQ